MTHTYVTLEISFTAYQEIAAKLREAGYDHAFDGQTIDMHGLALVPAPIPEGEEAMLNAMDFGGIARST